MESHTDERILSAYRDTIDALYAYVARNAAGDRALAEDVTQETWLRAVREWRRKGPPDKPLAWLMTVAHNLLVSYYRRRPMLQFDATSGVEPSSPASDAAAQAEDAEAAISTALGRMPRHQAQLIEAFHFDGRPTAHIADTAGVSGRAIEGRLRRARQRLRRELESLFGSGGTTR